MIVLELVSPGRGPFHQSTLGTLKCTSLGIGFVFYGIMNLSSKWFGWLSERKAAQFLKRKGYKILHKNYRTRLGEIDLIVKRKEHIVFVEVKAMVDSPDFVPMDHFDWRKQKKQILLGRYYLNTLKREYYARFDLITVVKKDDDYFIEHHENVIQEP